MLRKYNILSSFADKILQNWPLFFLSSTMLPSPLSKKYLLVCLKFINRLQQFQACVELACSRTPTKLWPHFLSVPHIHSSHLQALSSGNTGGPGLTDYTLPVFVLGTFFFLLVLISISESLILYSIQFSHLWNKVIKIRGLCFFKFIFYLFF